MNTAPQILNVVVVGLGGQGVLKATEILSLAAFDAGWDVKKSEIHGMSQRGGSVSGDVRFGEKVFSPMIPAGRADFLITVDSTQIDPNRHYLNNKTVILRPEDIDIAALPSKQSLNVALLGKLSNHLPQIPVSCWQKAIQTALGTARLKDNLTAFDAGRLSVR